MTSRTHTPEDVQKIMESWRNSESDYERGFIDGMQKQMQSSVDKAVNAMSQRTWVGLTEAQCGVLWKTNMTPFEYYQAIEAKLKEKNT